HLMVHLSGKDRFLASALSRVGAANDVTVTFTVDKADAQADAAWIKLNPRILRKNLRTIFRQANPTHFLDLTAPNELSVRITQVLPTNTTHIDPTALFQSKSSF